MGHQFQKHFYPDTEVADAVLPLPLPFSASLPSPSARPPARRAAHANELAQTRAGARPPSFVGARGKFGVDDR